MTESDIYQIVGKAYCDGVSHGMEKSANAEAAILKSIFRAADKGKAALQSQGGNGIPGLYNIIKKIGFNPEAGSTYGQFYNALTNKDGLANMARGALLNRAALREQMRARALI